MNKSMANPVIKKNEKLISDQAAANAAMTSF